MADQNEKKTLSLTAFAENRKRKLCNASKAKKQKPASTITTASSRGSRSGRWRGGGRG